MNLLNITVIIALILTNHNEDFLIRLFTALSFAFIILNVFGLVSLISFAWIPLLLILLYKLNLNKKL